MLPPRVMPPTSTREVKLNTKSSALSAPVLKKSQFALLREGIERLRAALIPNFTYICIDELLTC